VDGSDPAYNESAKESLRAGERNVESTTQLEFASAQEVFVLFEVGRI